VKVLGIESSADETAAAVVEDGYKLLSSTVASSLDMHTFYGGIVPEIAARSHIESIIPVINQALYQAKYGQDTGLDEAQGNGEKYSEAYMKYGERASQPVTKQFAKSSLGKVGFAQFEQGVASDLWDDIDAIAVTQGPGLSGSLLIGVLSARTLAIAKNKPLYAINHVEAHVYANFITDTSLPGYKLSSAQPEFPLLALIVSGGHSQLALFEDHFKYTLLGQTSDDAVGEAFDKVAKILGLPYPGGPNIDKAAHAGNPDAIKLPKAKMASPYEFSFSGLKTAVLRASQALAGKDYTLPSVELPGLLNESQKADIAASFQKTAISTLVDSLETAVKEFSPKSIVIAGGVAANQELREQISDRVKQSVLYPDIKLCTDNAAMIASLGYFKANQNQPAADPYSLEIEPNLSM
jgi:N6-L-threonylcarbamoyladenine synthase